MLLGLTGLSVNLLAWSKITIIHSAYLLECVN
jgi:hypothetical protein